MKVLTWNIWMMPRFTLQSPRNEKRASVIAEELLKQDFDIICFEKAFDGGARAVLWEAFRKAGYHQYGPANNGFSLKVNSGVWILSRIELTGQTEIQYRACAGVECLSRKGAMLLDGVFQGHPFQIAATHLEGESGDLYTDNRQQVRNRQMEQLRDDLLRPHRMAGMPLILAGDFDTPRFDPGTQSNPGAAPLVSREYESLLRTFGNPQSQSVGVTFDDNCSENDLAISGTGRRDETDYILVSPNGANLTTSWTRMIFRHPGWDGRHQDLSYRYAVAASIEFH